MDAVAPLPLAGSELPEGIRKFGDPKAPAPARTMAAKGLVPVKGDLLVALLAQLSADPDDNVQRAAAGTLKGLPESVLLAAAGAPMHPSLLDRLADVFRERDDVLERIASNAAAADATLARVARTCSEYVSEVIATDQQRLLGAPRIVEALYKNKSTRMSTADRLIELCARNGVELDGIPAFEQHVQAIQGQLIPEPSDEPLPSDLDFREALEADEDDTEAIEQDSADGTETLKEKFKPLWARIGAMTTSEKIRLATIGDAAARAVLVRDPNRLVSYAAISSPMTNEAEAARIANSKEVAEDILRYVGNKREWIRNYEVKKSLIFNPKTPLGIALRYLAHMRDNDLRNLSRSRNVPAPLKQAANQRIQQKQRGGGRR